MPQEILSEIFITKLSVALLAALGIFFNALSAPARENVEFVDSSIQNIPAPVKSANSLHLEATRFFDQHDVEKAIDREKDAIKLAPGYWLPHAALGYLYFGRGGPAIQEASESIKTAHPRLADINLALLLQYFHMYEQSLESFKALLKADPESIEAKAGLASCLIGMKKIDEGRKILDDAYAAKPEDPVVLDAIARAYFDAGDMNTTKKICQEALALSHNQNLSDKLRKLLLVAAVNTSDVNLLNSMKDDVFDFQPYERIWLRGMQLKFAKSSLEGSDLLRLCEPESTTNEQWLSLATILQERAVDSKTEKTSWLQMSKNCLKHAEAIEPNNVEIRIRLAAIEERLGNEQGALNKITAGWNDTACEASPKAIYANDELAKQDVTTLAKSVIRSSENGYSTNLSTVEITLAKVTCGCRYKLIRYTLMNLPGVINVMIRSGPHPSALLIFDNRICSKNSILENKAVTALHENLEVAQEHRVSTIAELDNEMVRFENSLPAPSFFAESVTLRFPSIDPAYQTVDVVSADQPSL
jgi:tetratricopeptide (TPR) repeat protein